MEARLNTEQEQLLALQEKFFFEDLTAEEQAFVLRQTSQEAFDRARMALIESKAIYSVPEPRSLVLPAVAQSRFRLMAVAFSSAAAAALFTFFFFPSETIVVQTVDKPIYLTADTVYVKDKTVDTVIEYLKGETIYVEMSGTRPNIELSEYAKSKDVLPPLSTLDLKNRGESKREDKLNGIMDGVFY